MIKASIGILFVCLCVAAGGADAKPLRLKACGHHDYPPWNWRSGDVIIGACAEVTKTLFEKIGVEVDLTYTGPWKRCQVHLKNGDVDLNICSFINQERQAYSEFIMTPMGFNENAVFVNKGDAFPFETWQDLTGKTAGMVHGVSIGQAFDDFLKANTKIERVRSFNQNFKKLNIGRVDFIPLGRFAGRAMLKAFHLDDRVMDLPTSILTGNLHISMSRKSPYLYLLPQVEKLMQEEGYNEWVESLLSKYVAIYVEQYQLQQAK